jgi:hypothetical protein
MVDGNDTPLAGMARRDLMVAGFGAAALAVGLGRRGTALAQTGPVPLRQPRQRRPDGSWSNNAAQCC